MAVFLAGCGSAATVGPAATVSPVGQGSGVAVTGSPVSPTVGSASPAPSTPPPTLTGSTTVTEADSDATVRLRVGEHLDVVLGGSSGQWDPPRADGSALRLTAASGGYPSGQPARATYLAVRAGTDTVTSTTDYPCRHTQPACEVAQRIWMIRVIVG